MSNDEDKIIEVERADRTTVRLDLRASNGWTTVGALRSFVAGCEANGGDDSTRVAIVGMQGLLGGSYFQPIIGATIDHRTAPLAASPLSEEKGE